MLAGGTRNGRLLRRSLGAFLALRCTSRAREYSGAVKARWLVAAAVSLGTTGIWVMHFIAMLGYTIPGMTITYNVPETIGSMVLANMGGAYPNQLLTLAIKGTAKDMAMQLEGKTVTVTGQVVDYKGKPEIVVTDAAQVKVQ